MTNAAPKPPIREASTGDAPACVLAESGPVVVDADDPVIENLHIVSDGGPAITIDGHPGVTDRNVWIEHAGGPGIAIGGGSDDVRIEDVAIEHTGAPDAGQNPSDGLNNIECHGSGSDGVGFRRARCRENICEDQGRGKPLSNALMRAGHPGYTKIRLEDSDYSAACNGNVLWPEGSFEVVELDELDFAMRAPIELDLCWE